MQSRSPVRLAFYITLIVCAIQIFGCAVLFFFNGWPEDTWLIAIVLAVSDLMIFFIIRYFLFRFIMEKIKPVYKSIHTQKLKPGSTQRKFSSRDDIISNVNEEANEWAASKNREIERLRQMETYRKEFVGNVSHELKTPIFVTQGYILTLLDGGLEDPAINRKYLEKAEHAIERMISIVNDLETISRLEHGRLTLQKTSFDIVSLTRNVFDVLEEKAGNKSIRMFFKEGSEKPVFVYADQERIRQVLVNLVVNSINYGQENGYVRLAFYDMDEHILVEVKDDGIGIGEEHIGRIFERFYRVDKGRSMKSGGTGLGLSIVKHIIEAHNQTINVRSDPGKGTTITFTLKIKE